MNYRNEPLYPRIIDPTTQKPSTSGTLGDLAFAYTSQTRPWLTSAGPYPPLTPGLLPGDPFTPLMRSYAGDDVQVRTLVTGQINPHNLAIHGVHWLSQPGWGRFRLARQPGDGHLGALRADLPPAELGLDAYGRALASRRTT